MSAATRGGWPSGSIANTIAQRGCNSELEQVIAGFLLYVENNGTNGSGGARMVRNKRKRKKFKPRKLLKRLLVLAIFLALGSGLLWLGRSTYRLIAGWRNRPALLSTVQAEQVTDIPGIDAEAILLRQEIVVLADKPGVVNLLAEAGAQVDSGHLVLEVVDKTLLAEIDAELQKIDKGEQQGAETNQSLADVTSKLTASQGSLYEVMDNYKQALRVQAVQTYSGLYNSLTKLAKQVVQLQQDHVLLAQSQVTSTEQRQRLEDRRQQAIVPVHTPVTGAVYYWVDGLEEVATLSKLAPGLWEQLQGAKPEKTYQTQGDSQVEAGQPVFKVAVDDKSYLLLKLSAENSSVPSEWESVSVQLTEGEVQEAFSGRIIEHEGLEQGQLLLSLEAAEPLVLPRFSAVSLRKDGEVFCSVPKQAVVTVDNETVVFILEGNIVKAQPVRILQQQTKKSVIVAGIKPGVPIVKRPEGLVDGQDVTDRLRK
jgi:hypothetical protein